MGHDLVARDRPQHRDLTTLPAFPVIHHEHLRRWTSRRHLPPVSPARANSVAGGLGARPGQRPLPAEQDLREALRGFLAAPVALQLTTHLDHAGRFAAGQGDAVQPGLVRLG